jgi:predicted nuclease of restriction endonuclease-like (RecB) superfamily
MVGRKSRGKPKNGAAMPVVPSRRLSKDLKEAFPDMSGFSPRNLKYMREFAEHWSDISILQRTVAQIPCWSNIALMEKLQDEQSRLWYAEKTIENGGYWRQVREDFRPEKSEQEQEEK